ncbi:PadR family transcriptional regulator [Motilibacter aurantiacus]|uniref:PadR family transcriptional regulator n=1 Tax=Motilibacter aurantiacus TaxID=2714955 RepID=UPI00140C2D70|nr:PadR family transcriptional regulator [Motilibacter aurantiacus]NHC47416.1 helix-turn-helix transcriptional regulator [Motilibacter aurantiacus]
MSAAEIREPSFLILSALAGGPLHGYAVISEVSELSEGRVRLRPGTLYAALERLAGDGLVAPHGERVVDGRLRRYFALTDEGAGALAEQAERMRQNAERATARLRQARAPRQVAPA